MAQILTAKHFTITTRVIQNNQLVDVVTPYYGDLIIDGMYLVVNNLDENNSNALLSVIVFPSAIIRVDCTNP